MTPPPDRPREPSDPGDEHPETRQFDPFEDPASVGEPTAPTEAYGDQPYRDPYGQGDGGDQYGGDQYPTEAYSDTRGGTGQYAAPYDTPPPSGGPPSAGAGASGGGPGKRTPLLILATLAAIALIAIVAVLIVRGSGGDGGTTSAATTPTTTTAPTTTTTTTEETTTTTEPTTTTTTRTVTPGAVVYQITGNGEVVGLRFRSGADFVVVAATGTPWSQTAQVGGGSAELTAIVVRGPVTCNILQGEELLSSSTSSGGPLRCAASVQ